MELVLPNHYVALEQEEMMYLEGGDLGISAVLGTVSGVIAMGGAIYGAGTAATTRAYYAGLRNSEYQRIKWQIRAFAVVLGHAFGVAFMTGFENAFYAKVTGQ